MKALTLILGVTTIALGSYVVLDNINSAKLNNLQSNNKYQLTESEKSTSSIEELNLSPISYTEDLSSETGRLGKCKRIIGKPTTFRLKLEGLEFFVKKEKILGIGALNLSRDAIQAVTDYVIGYDLFQHGQCQTKKALLILCRKNPPPCLPYLERLNTTNAAVYNAFNKYLAEIKKIEASSLTGKAKNEKIVELTETAKEEKENLSDTHSNEIEKVLSETSISDINRN